MKSVANIFKCDFCKEVEWTYPMQEDLTKITRGTITIKYDKPNSEARLFDMCGKCINEIIDRTKNQ